MFISLDAVGSCVDVTEATKWWRRGVRDSVSHSSEPGGSNHWPWWQQSEGDAWGLMPSFVY